jgi:hypothetical protein
MGEVRAVPILLAVAAPSILEVVMSSLLRMVSHRKTEI